MIGITCVATESTKEDEEWLWDTPLAALAKAKVPAKSLKAFTEEAVRPFGCDRDVVVDRNTDILKQMLRKYKNPSFDITKRLCIEFVDEVGIDAGGVSREFFHLLMERLKQGPGGAINVFEGLPGHLVPIHNYDVLSGGLFILAGKMILHAILNDCNGVPGISRAVVSYISTGSRESAVEYITLEDIPDPDLKEKLTQVCFILKIFMVAKTFSSRFYNR